MESETIDANANIEVEELKTKNVDYLEPSFISSMVSHWNPNVIQSLQRPGSIPTMISHCALLPPPGSSFLSMAEVLEGLEAAFEKIFEKMKWSDKNN